MTAKKKVAYPVTWNRFEGNIFNQQTIEIAMDFFIFGGTMQRNTSLAAFPGYSFVSAAQRVFALADGTEELQICPQNHGVLNEQVVNDLQAIGFQNCVLTPMSVWIGEDQESLTLPPHGLFPGRIFKNWLPSHAPWGLRRTASTPVAISITRAVRSHACSITWPA